MDSLMSHPGKQVQQQAREAKRAALLRENLKRRKLQAKERSASVEDKKEEQR